jgi:hypothetical protein
LIDKINVLVLLLQYSIETFLWWPNFVVGLWFSGITLVFGVSIVYADYTLKTTAQDIEQLKGFMYSFKKV